MYLLLFIPAIEIDAHYYTTHHFYMSLLSYFLFSQKPWHFVSCEAQHDELVVVDAIELLDEGEIIPEVVFGFELYGSKRYF